MKPTIADHGNDSLSFGDALFLYLERPGMPLHVASLAIFEGVISRDDCMAYIASKLPLIPRYRQHVVSAPLHLGLPAWDYDPRFDLGDHIREVTLRAGTQAELKAATARVLSVPLDRSRPLWDMTLFRGLRGNRTAVVIRVHHCLADGLSGVGLMQTILDDTPVAAPAKRARLPKLPPSRPERSLIESAVASCLSTVERVLTAQSELLQFAEQFLAATAKPQEMPQDPRHPGLGDNHRLPSLEEWNRMMPELLSPAQRLPFNVVCRGPQRFECAQVPLAELKRIKHLCGATVNDVVLSLVTSAVQRYVTSHGVKVRGRSLRIVMPVSVRSKEEAGELGNRITFVPVTVPMGPRRVRSLVDAVHRNVATLKSARIGELVGFAGTVLGTLPAPLQAAIGPLASQLPLSVCNLICTNVPGPKQPLYLLGHKMLSCHPYVPIGGEMGLNIAVLSYDGVVYFGFTGDVHAVPDLHVLPKLLAGSFAALQKELGISRSSRPAQRASASTQTAARPETAPAPQMESPERRKPSATVEERAYAAAAGD